jgi:hypothetical protein
VGSVSHAGGTKGGVSVTRYRVSEPVHLETHHGTHGPIELIFEAGEVTPRSEQEEAALLHLKTIGLAEEVPEQPEPGEMPDAP